MPLLADAAPPAIETPEGPRVTIGGREYDWFRSNSYLGLQLHPDVLRAACDATLRYGMKLRDRRPVGCHPVVLEWEEQARAFFASEEAVLLGSGYAGGLVMAAALDDGFDVAFVDAEAHANLFDGLRACGKRIVTFAHVDTDDLRRQLRARLGAGERPLVATDGLFPISGEIAPVPAYVDALGEYEGAMLWVDDAHAFGVLGPDGRGTLDHHGLSAPWLHAYGTMSKAFGAAGGIVPCSPEVRERIERRSAAWRSTTKPPPGVVAAGARALEIARTRPELRDRLRAHVSRVRQGLRAMGLDVGDAPSPIVCLNRRRGLDLEGIARRMFDEERIAVLYAASGYANVPAGGCLVFTLSALHGDAQVERLLDAFRRAA